LSFSDSATQSRKAGRRTLLTFGGLGLVLLAAALLLISRGSLTDDAQAGAIEFEQVPKLEPGQTSDLALSAAPPPEVGDIVRNFSLEDLDGNRHELDSLRGRPVVINFWATWCAPCRVEMPALQAAYEQYRQDGLRILAVDFDESPDAVRTFFYDELGLTFTPLIDEGGPVTQQFGVFNFPTTFFVEQGGRIAAIHRGPLHPVQLEEYLARIIPEPG
jgi:peroxiredoxin